MKPADPFADTALTSGTADGAKGDHCWGPYELSLLWLRALGMRSTSAQPPKVALQSRNTLRVWREGREYAAREARKTPQAP